jgi:GNAT superfamily N-acetyltransferase
MTEQPTVEIVAFDPSEPDVEHYISPFVDLWNRAMGAEMTISPAFVRYNVKPSAGVVRSLWLATVKERVIGAALATALHDEPLVNGNGEGWLDALVVEPELQRRGVGRQLLAAAERWLLEQGCQAIQVGGGLRPFAPGPPEASSATHFLIRNGYTHFDTSWDLAATLAGYTPPQGMREAPCAVRPATPAQAGDLLGFLRREFPGRWRYEAEMFLADGGRISDFMLLWTERGVDGCCLLTFPDSVRPIERFYPYQLPKPWGQLGSIGVSAACRGQGFGAALLDGGLRRLHNNGINGCVIDWTTLLDFYGKFGFEQHRAYAMVGRTL